jgi:hypothetical protein
MPRKLIAFRISEIERKALKTLAATLKCTESDAMRMAVNEALCIRGLLDISALHSALAWQRNLDSAGAGCRCTTAGTDNC